MNHPDDLRRVVLASASPTRQDVLRNAGLSFEILPANIDEDSVKKKMRADGCSVKDTAQRLSDLKAQKVSEQTREALVVGADQMVNIEKWKDYHTISSSLKIVCFNRDKIAENIDCDFIEMDQNVSSSEIQIDAFAFISAVQSVNVKA